jgi:hypothetical protein
MNGEEYLGAEINSTRLPGHEIDDHQCHTPEFKSAA